MGVAGYGFGQRQVLTLVLVVLYKLFQELEFYVVREIVFVHS